MSLFLKMAALTGAFSTNGLFRQAHAAKWEAASRVISDLDAGQVAQNEDFWSVIRRAYSVGPEIINLKNGGVSPSPFRRAAGGRTIQPALGRGSVIFHVANP